MAATFATNVCTRCQRATVNVYSWSPHKTWLLKCEKNNLTLDKPKIIDRIWWVRFIAIFFKRFFFTCDWDCLSWNCCIYWHFSRIYKHLKCVWVFFFFCLLFYMNLIFKTNLRTSVIVPKGKDKTIFLLQKKKEKIETSKLWRHLF